MRVLYLSPSAGLGGAERALVENLRALRALEPSWTLGLVATEEGPTVASAAALGVDTRVLALPARFAATGESGRRPIATILELVRGTGPLAGYVRALRAHVAAWAPDIVHSNGIKMHVLGAWTSQRAALIWHAHDYLSPRQVSASLLRWHATRVSTVLANSHSVAADVARLLGSRVPIATVYNAIDLTRFTPHGDAADLDAAAGLAPAPAGTVRVALVATFARWKGHDVFIRAIAALAKQHAIRGYIVGGPVYRTGQGSQASLDELRALVRELGLDGTVGFTGFFGDTSLAYRAADIVVHASTSPEPFGLSIAEAMACERAVVMSDAGGAQEIGSPGKTCLTHPPGNVPALSAQIERLVTDAALRQRLATAAAASVRERFTHERCARALRTAYVAAA